MRRVHEIAEDFEQKTNALEKELGIARIISDGARRVAVDARAVLLRLQTLLRTSVDIFGDAESLFAEGGVALRPQTRIAMPKTKWRTSGHGTRLR